MSSLEPLLFQIRASCLMTTALVLLAWPHQGRAESQSDREGLAFFENRIRPVLVEHCHACHSAEAKTLRGELRLDTREGFLKGGKRGAVVVAGRPDQSRLILALNQTDKDLKMPPPSENRHKLPQQTISDFVTWVKLGAPFAEARPPTKGSRPTPWAFSPLQKPQIPKVKTRGWVKTSIDPFLLATMEEQGVSPSPQADKLSLIRRATYDLTGLPPTPEEVDAFIADKAPDAFSKLVDRLLSSPHYGERWGRHWLDVVRYADTAGDTADYPVGLAWKYRNYVIDALNADKPYDEFLREQIAGDILAEQEPTRRYAERVTATGYLAISRRFGFDSENYHHLTIQDTLDTLGQSVLGLSFGCARCHDHKFDPITMKDYYALYGIFASTRYPFAGSEQKPKLRAMVPLIPARESQPKWRDYDQRVALLSTRLARQKQPVPSAIYRSLHDPDGDFEIQKDAAGGSYGVIVPPWAWEGKMSVRGSAQSPFKNLYPMGRFGVFIPGGKEEYTLSQALYPKRDASLCRQVYVNLDFRAGPTPTGAQGYHRFWIGGSTRSPAVEMLITSEGLFQRIDNQILPLATLLSNQWHSLQLVLDLEQRRVTGSLGRADGTTDLGTHPLSKQWSGVINYVQLDSSLRSSNLLSTLEIDNFVAQETPIAPVSTTLPIPHLAPGQPNPEALAAELDSLVGLDGDLEGQTEGAAPSKPWNGGPNSVVKILAEAQSPFRNVFPPGSMGIKMPRRAEYDGLGLTLSGPIPTNSAGVLFASFDFRCGAEATGGSGSWRFYIGHGAGNSAAIELFFNESTLFHRSGKSNEVAAALHPGEWHQVQLSLNLREKRYTGTLAHPQGSSTFSGSLASGWDGGIDYCFIDSYGHLPGIRPALSADNFSFGSNAVPALTSEFVHRDDTRPKASRQARIAEIHKQLKAFDADAKTVAEELTRLLVEGPCEMTYGMTEGTPQNARVQIRGEPDRPGDESSRGFVQSLGGSALSPETQGSGRLELARWLTRADNPLTARVMVNRIWQYHFGHGLVGTPNDFGTRGQRPTHPELLDHLATQFIQSRWSLKAMHRLIMNSAAYQQSTEPLAADSTSPKTSVGLQKASGYKGLYASFENRRLSAEEIRDAILAISGDLDRTPGKGHPFPSPVTAAFTQHGPYSAVYEHNQRSVYLMTQRIKRHPFLALFDGPDPNATTAERRTTTVPTQALFFLNSPFVHEKATHLATRLRSEFKTDEQRVTRLWKLTAGRIPTSTERDEALVFLKEYQAELRASGQPDVENTALAAYARSLLGSNEFLHLD